MPITVTDLSFSYKRGTPFAKKVLHDISLEIKDGEFIGLIGPTQSGKTTLAQHLNALLIPQSGRVSINGFDTGDPKTDLVNLRLSVGYVFQNPDYQLFASTVGEDIAFGPLNQKLTASAVSERVKEAMNQVGLDYDLFCNRDIYALSGGQKRRAAIAGVLACRPQILILDDITAGLDPRGREEILNVIRKLHSDQQITIIFVSTSMDEAAELATRLIVIDRGRKIAEGPSRDIFNQAALLRSIGLELPEVMGIAEKLRAHGYNIKATPLNIKEAVDSIASAFTGGERHS